MWRTNCGLWCWSVGLHLRVGDLRLGAHDNAYECDDLLGVSEHVSFCRLCIRISEFMRLNVGYTHGAHECVM